MGHIPGERRSNNPGRTGPDILLGHFLEGDAADPAGGEYVPTMDVLETAEAVEILVDVPGIAASSLRLAFSQGTLVVAGRKAPAVCAHREATFHLAERGFGRFVRAIRLAGAFNVGGASATLVDGVLHLILPRIEERRGRDIRIDIRS